ncbi:hypothetical protein P1S61_03595 [Streptomyces sp. ME08-AFT2]|uniref:hypothetical protein n=1 Tax=Streptomyces TaxID=1883 RepID=UPI00078964CD|nr:MULTISPECIES: hypothetical protein [unclassified Streptomyces]MDX3308203.1 hypothetical protein [Streptomyces sp. ME08-AFT2]
MENLLYLLPVLACPVGMGLMMWFMMRPKHGAQAGPTADRQELTRLRKEIDALRSEQASRETTPQDRPA